MERTSLVELPRRHRPEVQKAHQGVARLLSHVRMWMLALVVATAGGVLPAAVATPAAARAAVDTIPVGDNPLGVTVSPLGNRVYVANAGDDSVSVIGRPSNTVLATIPVGDSPAGVTVGGLGTLLYVTNQGSDSVSVISTLTNTVVATIPVGDTLRGRRWAGPEPAST